MREPLFEVQLNRNVATADCSAFIGVRELVRGFEPHPLAAYNPMSLSPEGKPSPRGDGG